MARTIKLEQGEVLAVTFGDVEFLIDSSSDMLTVWTATKDDNGEKGTIFSKTLDKQKV